MKTNKKDEECDVIRDIAETHDIFNRTELLLGPDAMEWCEPTKLKS